jgi:hypothetical protein
VEKFFHFFGQDEVKEIEQLMIAFGYGGGIRLAPY